MISKIGWKVQGFPVDDLTLHTQALPINIPTRKVHLLQVHLWPVLTHSHLPESIIYNRAHSRCHTFCVCMPGWVWLFATLSTVARQGLLSMGFFRQEYWSVFPFPFSRGSFQPRDWTHVSCVSCIAGRFFTYWITRGVHTFCGFEKCTLTCIEHYSVI